MNWESLLMPIIVVGLALVGGIGGYFTYKTKTDDLDKRVNTVSGVITANVARIEALEAASQQRVATVGEKLVALELRVERECVKKDDLSRVEDRLGKRLDGVEHAVKNATAQIIGALSERVRQPSTR